MTLNIAKLTLGATAALLLAACSETPRTADYYIKNTKEQANKLTECQQRPQIKDTPNCISAQKAEEIIQQGTDAIKAYISKNQ